MNKNAESYRKGFAAACVRHGLDPAAFEKHALSTADLLGLLPGGAILEGAIKPEEGASRAETIALGGGGGLLGTLAGGALGAAATARKTGPEGDEQIEFSLPAAGAGALGGGFLGNIAGRWLAQRPQTEDQKKIEELKKIIEQAAKGGAGPQVTINMGEAPKKNKEEKDNG